MSFLKALEAIASVSKERKKFCRFEYVIRYSNTTKRENVGMLSAVGVLIFKLPKSNLIDLYNAKLYGSIRQLSNREPELVSKICTHYDITKSELDALNVINDTPGSPESRYKRVLAVLYELNDLSSNRFLRLWNKCVSSVKSFLRLK